MAENDYDMDQTAEAGDSLIAVLDEIIEIVTLARGVPMSASAMINRSEVLDLLHTARDIVPDQIEAADTIIAEASEVRTEAQQRAKTILERAHADADQTIQQARMKASDLVSEHDITKGAEKRAAEIMAEARMQAKKMNAGADRYSDDSLAILQTELENLLASVHAGRHELSRREEARLDEERRGDASHQQVAEPGVHEERQDERSDGMEEGGQQPSLNEVRFPLLDDEEGFEPPYDSER